MRPFHGVSTKWLGLYMAYFKRVHELGRSEDKASRQVRLGDYVHRWRDMNPMPLPFRDVMMREVKVRYGSHPSRFQEPHAFATLLPRRRNRPAFLNEDLGHLLFSPRGHDL